MLISEFRQRLKHAKPKIEIRKFCKQKKITNINFVEEKISGTKDWKKRKLGNLLDIMKEGDTLVLTELSRLGRSMMMIFSILEILLKKKIKVYAIKENYELGDNIQSQVLAFAFSISAQVERDLISERTKMGLERARREGKHIGRKKGQKSKKLKLSGKGAYIQRELKKNRSKNSLAKELNVTWVTLQKFIELKKLK